MTRFLILMALIASNSFAAGIQKWTDESGNVNYGDTPPVKTQTQLISVSPPPSNPGKPLPRLNASEDNEKLASDKAEKNKVPEVTTREANKVICEKSTHDLEVISSNSVIRMRNNDGTERILSDEEIDQRRIKLEQDIKQYCK